MDYTRLKCTARMAEAIKSIGEDCNELRVWKESGSTSCVPFSLLQNVLTAETSSCGYLHELLEDSELILPSPDTQPKRSTELTSNLERARAIAEQREYNRMVRNVDPAANQMNRFKLGLEVQSVNRQMCAVVNFLVTVIGAFAFGYFAGSFAGYSVPICVFLGLVLGLIVFIADLYFLVRTPQNAPNIRKKIKNH